MQDQIRHYENKLAFEMDSWDLNHAMTTGQAVVAVDARKPEAFEAEHIPGAVNIPHRTMTMELAESLDRDVVYVTYCDGIGCNASTKGALNLARLGLKTVELLGGLDWWKRDGYPTSKNTGSPAPSCGC